MFPTSSSSSSSFFFTEGRPGQKEPKTGQSHVLQREVGKGGQGAFGLIVDGCKNATAKRYPPPHPATTTSKRTCVWPVVSALFTPIQFFFCCAVCCAIWPRSRVDPSFKIGKEGAQLILAKRKEGKGERWGFRVGFFVFWHPMTMGGVVVPSFFLSFYILPAYTH